VNDADKPKIEELAQEMAFGNRYREARRIEGIDIAQFYADLAAAQEQTLTSPDAREDFTELCNDRCFPITLAALVVLLRYSPQLESYWAELVGRPDNRAQSARNLKLAIQRLERIFVDVISSEKQGQYGEKRKRGMPPRLQCSQRSNRSVQRSALAAHIIRAKRLRSAGRSDSQV
jgi:hypothetical protein